MATRKTTKKTVKTEEPAVVEKTLFQLMGEKYPANEADVNVEVGTVHVKTRLGVGEVSTLVRTIVDACVDGKTGEVMWELVDAIAKMMIFTAYTGVEVGDVAETYLGVAGDGRLYQLIEPYIDHYQLQTIWEGVHRRLQAREQMNTATGVARLNALLDGVQELMDEIGKMSEGFDGEQAVAALQHLNQLATGK